MKYVFSIGIIICLILLVLIFTTNYRTILIPICSGILGVLLYFKYFNKTHKN